ncbi:TetR/AcrR family transcriptional regulator [Kibdelosporangium phytohabitans]|uniref:TetR family transcriptional regulator n=1 Tax=Kibdelosporangium phytohabitans TaxID=860235 RepID=A0A0N9I894_9PSEU|nr:TetR/AcrR family transcriptional regulator [Kibdelosporangium phytohabitans]ALG11003.1 TetR family transcriptional regulator [Kibdelosporangium phytohabitans]MBE1462225.1 AcrR family transcriptional regulator [Kibdelosporangium phytohabitans]
MPPRRTFEDGRNFREHLITTAAAMIAEHGTAGLTVRAIAKQARVADGLLYNHFTDKEELLAEALREHVRTVENGLGTLPEPGTGTIERNLAAQLTYGLALHKAILPAFAGLIGQPAVLERLSQNEEDSWRDRLAGYLEAEQRQGRLRPDADTGAATALIVGICHETVLSSLLPHTPATRAASVDAIVATVLSGIA